MPVPLVQVVEGGRIQDPEAGFHPAASPPPGSGPSTESGFQIRPLISVVVRRLGLKLLNGRTILSDVSGKGGGRTCGVKGGGRACGVRDRGVGCVRWGAGQGMVSLSGFRE